MDLIERQAAIALAKDICVPTKDGAVYKHRCIDTDAIRELPTADVVEVVRCKDCVWYDERRPYANGHTLYECRNLERFFPLDFFCKDGERREDAG